MGRIPENKMRRYGRWIVYALTAWIALLLAAFIAGLNRIWDVLAALF
jgi:hypothetical protein